MNLTGRTILITGGGSGIGGGLASALHALGNRVIITGRREAVLKEFAARHPGVETHVMDVAIARDVDRVAEAVSRAAPNLDLLINNAGVMLWKDFSRQETLADPLFEELDTNVKGLVLVSRAFLPLLLRQKEAHLVNVSSGLAYVPLASAPIYSATKAAVHAFSLSLRHQLRGTSVRVVELAPPGVKTDLGKGPGAPEETYPMMELDAFIAATMRALGSRREELPIGPSVMLRLGSRFLPKFFFRFLNPS